MAEESNNRFPARPGLNVNVEKLLAFSTPKGEFFS